MKRAGMAKRMRWTESGRGRGMWTGILAALAVLCAVLAEGEDEGDEGAWLEMRGGKPVVSFGSGTDWFHRVFTVGRLDGNNNWRLTNVLIGAEGWQSWTDEVPARAGFYRVQRWKTTNDAVDSDNDGLPDRWEVAHREDGFNPMDPVDGGEADWDGDGLSNVEEFNANTFWYTNDSDGDGMLDKWEHYYGLDPTSAGDKDGDPDKDELLNYEEHDWHTNPSDADKDGDGIADGWDTDGDGMPDGWEVQWVTNGVHIMNPTNSADRGEDWDGDGLLNFEEFEAGTSPLNRDCDDDGVPDGDEVHHKPVAMDPLNPDTDSDGLPDGWEVENGLDPCSDGGLKYGLKARWTFDERGVGVITNHAGTNTDWNGVPLGMTEANWTNGARCGKALWFNGNGQYVLVTNGGERLLGRGPFTVTWVCKFDPEGAPGTPALGGEMEATNKGWRVWIEKEKGKLWWAIGDRFMEHQGQMTNAAVLASDWTDVALTWDGTNAAWGYVNGTVRGKSQTGFWPADTNEFMIGACRLNLGSRYWRGWIDDMRVYGQSLTPEQLREVNDWLGDLDGDGLINGLEYRLETVATNVDTDGDGLWDGDEYWTWGTVATNKDTDGDGMWDGWETQWVTNGVHIMNPTNAADWDGDLDRDNLNNRDEFEKGTNPLNSDSDGDGLPDGEEVWTWGTVATNKDTDGDLMWDGWETKWKMDGTNIMNPTNAADWSWDSDGDNLNNRTEFHLGTDPTNPDSDGDGFPDGDEVARGTDPLRRDSDGDGLPDGWEVTYGLNPVSDGGTNHGLVAWWKMDGKLTNAAGTAWTAQMVGNGTWLSGRGQGGALYLNGDGQYVRIPETNAAGPVFPDGKPFTVTWVCKCETNELLPYAALGGEKVTSKQGWWVRFEKTDEPDKWLWGSTGDGNELKQVQLAESAALTEWTDVALVCDGKEVRGYVNGVATGGARKVGFPCAMTNEVLIGACGLHKTQSYWKGWIDDVRFYRESLSAEELGEVNDWLGDADGDGLTNGREYELGTDPTNVDTDRDGLWDGVEVKQHGTDPLRADTDGDGLPDGWEVENELDPCSDGGAEKYGLVARWTFDEKEGNTVSNHVGANAAWDGKLYRSNNNSPWNIGPENWTNGARCGGALYFDGDQRYMSVSETAPEGRLQTNGGPFTVTWVCKGDPDGHPAYAALGGEGSTAGWRVRYEGGSLLAWSVWTNKESQAVLTNAAGLTNWTDVAFVFDGENAWGAVNGVAGTNTPLAKIPDPSNELLVGGCEVNKGIGCWKGWIDDVRFYRQALTPEQLREVNDWLGDRDGDGLCNGMEYTLGTVATNVDTDGDTLWDGWEVENGLDPKKEDTDGDGMPDWWEVKYREAGMDPLVPDYNGDLDGDRLWNWREYELGTCPTNRDTDGDGLPDWQEVKLEGTDPLRTDTDSDGLPDWWEVKYRKVVNPRSDGGTKYGLVARWTFDEQEGNTVSNHVGANAAWNGKLYRNNTNSPWMIGPENWTNGARCGGALYFDGDQRYMRVEENNADGPVLATGKSFTVTWVCKSDTNGVPKHAALGGEMPTTNKGWRVRYEGTNLTDLALTWCVGDGENVSSSTLTNETSLTNWTDVALVWDGARKMAWGAVNGVTGEKMKVGFPMAVTNELLIGGCALNKNIGCWKGWIDDVRIFRKALSPKELQAVNDWLGDPDGDGLSNGREYELGTDPTNVDTDGDGLSDWEEVMQRGTDPLRQDTDGDGLPDEWEVQYHLNPRSDGGLDYGLVARWTFDETEGNTVSNHVGANAAWDGKLWRIVNKTSIVPWAMEPGSWTNDARCGGALYFDGERYMGVSETNPEGRLQTNGGPFTVTWVCKGDPDGHPALAALGGEGPTAGWRVRYEGGSSLAWTVGQTQGGLTNAAGLTNWTDMAFVFDGENAWGAVNGVAGTAKPLTAPPATANELLVGGCEVNKDIGCWKGWIDDVRFYRQALSTNELRAVNDWLGDLDRDGLCNGLEYTLGTVATNVDTDGDGLWDGAEYAWGTVLTNRDTDGDGMWDGWEVDEDNGLNPLENDAEEDRDNDTLSNLLEWQLGTKANEKDSDGDGLPDNEEYRTLGTYPWNADTDGDGLDDGWEVRNRPRGGTDPLSGMRRDLKPLVWLTFDEGKPGEEAFTTNRANELYSNGVPYRAELHWATNALRVEGKRGGAVWLDGKRSFLSVNQPKQERLLGTNGYTVSLWIKAEKGSHEFPTVFSDLSWVSNQGRGMAVREESSSNTLQMVEGFPGALPSRVAQLWGERWRGKWTHLAVVHEGAVLRMYLDGSLYGELEGAVTVTTNDYLYLGYGPVNAPKTYWKGAMDDVRIFGRALTREEIATLVEAEGDWDLSGTNNLAKAKAEPPKDLAEERPPASTEGSLDVTVRLGTVPPAGVHWLARYDGANPGSEVEVYLRDDNLHFELHDAEGGPHSVWISGVTANGYLTAGTNRVTASWRGFDGRAHGADLRLCLNGVDVVADGIWGTGAKTPKLTVNARARGEGYQDGAWTEGKWGEGTNSAHAWFGRRHEKDPAETGAVEVTGGTGTWHKVAYGMPGRPDVPGGEAEGKSKYAAEAEGKDPRVLVQDMMRPGNPETFVSRGDIGLMIERYRQFTDVVEYAPRWIRGTKWWTHEDESLKMALENGASNGVGIAMSGHEWWKAKVCLEHPTDRAGEYVRVTTNETPNGTELVLSLAETTVKMGDQTVKLADRADRSALTNYLDMWADALAGYPGCENYFLNETALVGIDGKPWDAATYSKAGLQWFREYTTNRYGTNYAKIKFPLPALPSMLATNGWEGMTVRVAPELEERAAMTRDPDIWAKWWEWREAVFATEIAGYASRLVELNASNANWRGMVLFVSPALAFTRRSGLNLELLAKVKGLDWLVMENTRLKSYGSQEEDLEEEIRLQLAAAKAVTEGGGAGFGSYVMVHAYTDPIKGNGTTNAKWNAAWVDNDVKLAVDSAFQSRMVVPYSAVMLMDRPPGTTTNWQNTHYLPEAEDQWLELRYTKLRSPPAGLEVAHPMRDYRLSWQAAAGAEGYQVEVAKNGAFGTGDNFVTNVAGTQAWVKPSDYAEPWRVRAVYVKRSYDDSGKEKGSKEYYGNWAVSSSGARGAGRGNREQAEGEELQE